MLVLWIAPAMLLLLNIHRTESEHMGHVCIGDQQIAVSCSEDSVIIVTKARLGRSAEYASGSFTCPATQDGCWLDTTVLADKCNRKKFCFMYPDEMKLEISICGAANYISFAYECIAESSTINICAASVVALGGTMRYIVNDGFPAAVPGEPHKCQCTIQRHPEATAASTYVSLDVLDALLQGDNCHQTLIADLPGSITARICSGELGFNGKHLSGYKLTYSMEKPTLTFEKIDNTNSDASFVVVALNVTGKVAVNCRQISALTTESATRPAPPLSTTVSQGPGSSTEHTITVSQSDAKGDTATSHMHIIIGVAVGAGVVVVIAVVVVIVAIRSRRKDARKKSSATPNPPATANGRQRHSVYERDEFIPEPETSSPPAAASSKPAKHYQPLDANHVQQLGASAGVYDEIKGFKVSDRETKKEPTYYNDASRPIPADFNPTETYATVDRTKTQTKKKANNDTEDDIIINPYIEQDDNNARPGILAPSQGVDNVSMEPMYDAAVDVNPFAQNDDF